jgi:thiol-disulfide isomerase/thioredoxin
VIAAKCLLPGQQPGSCETPVRYRPLRPCKATSPPVSEHIEVNATEFAEITREAKVSVLVTWAEWCGPCRMAAPEVGELAREMAARGLVLKVNTDENPTVAAQFSGSGDSLFRALARGNDHCGADGGCSTGRNAAMVRDGGVRGAQV